MNEPLDEMNRYKVEETEYYNIVCRVPGPTTTKNMHRWQAKPAFAVLDENSGAYIAFTTGLKEAERITDALNFWEAKKPA